MSGLHALDDRPSRPGLAVTLLGLVGLAPPALILAPHAATDALSAPPVASSAPGSWPPKRPWPLTRPLRTPAAAETAPPPDLRWLGGVRDGPPPGCRFQLRPVRRGLPRPLAAPDGASSASHPRGRRKGPARYMARQDRPRGSRGPRADHPRDPTTSPRRTPRRVRCGVRPRSTRREHHHGKARGTQGADQRSSSPSAAVTRRVNSARRRDAGQVAR